MANYDISKILSPENHYRVTDIMYQYWNSTGYSYDKNPRGVYGILFVTQGKIEFSRKGENFTVSSGDIVFFPKGIYYDAKIKPEFGETRDYLVNFEIEGEIPDNMPDFPIKILQIDKRNYIELFDSMISLKIRNSLDCFIIKSLFYKLLDDIVSGDKKTEKTEREIILKKAEEMLSGQTDYPISEIAKQCGISESGLRNLFSNVYGMSPLQYRLNIKINKAKYLLECTDMSVFDIGESLGFYDEAYFCKVFKSRVGVTPKKYAGTRKI